MNKLLDAVVNVEDFLQKDAQKIIPKKRKIDDLIKMSNEIYELMDDLVPKFPRQDQPSCSFWTNAQNEKISNETADGANKKVMDVIRAEEEVNCELTMENLVDVNRSDSEESNYGAQKKVIHVEVETMSNEQPDIERVQMRASAGHDLELESHESEEVVFKALPEQYKVPQNFKSLSQLTPSQHLENIIGVVTGFQPPTKSKGSDLFMKLFIMDPTYHKTAREILYFKKDKWVFPEVYCIGDIVCFHRIKTRCYCGNLQLMSNYSTASMVFPGVSDDAVSLETARYNSSKPSMLKGGDVKVVEQLRTWVQLNMHILQPSVLVTLAEIQDKAYHNVVGKVVQVKRCQNDDYQWSLTIYDGTKPQPESHQPIVKCLPQQKSTPPPESTTVPEGNGRILWDISGSRAKEKLIHVYLGRKHARTLWDLHLKAGNVLLFHNVWAEFDGVILNLFMDNSVHRDCSITFINPRSALGNKFEFI